MLALAPPASANRVGVAWHDQATADTLAQQRLRDAVALQLGVDADAIVIDAVAEAQRIEAYRLPPADAREISDLQARLDLASAQFRAGDLEAAAVQASVVLQRLQGRPELPGAAAMARSVHVLQGRIAWTRADEALAQASWDAAVAMDPESTLSTRRVPPDIAAAYEARRGEAQQQRISWTTPVFTGADVTGAQIEIDGRLGVRPVPLGEHFVVVRWPGAPAQAAVVGSGQTMALTEPEVVVETGLPVTSPDAEKVCERLSLSTLVLARLRRNRLGLQSYACGEGFGPVWYSDGSAFDEATWQAVDEQTWAAHASGRSRSVLLDRAPWPRPERATPPPPTLVRNPDPGDDEPVVAKPWYRRAWVWVVVGALVAGGITTGVVLGTRDPGSSVVVTDEFLRP